MAICHMISQNIRMTLQKAILPAANGCLHKCAINLPPAEFFSTSNTLRKIARKQGHQKKSAKVTTDISQIKDSVGRLIHAEENDDDENEQPRTVRDLTAEEIAVKGAKEMEECYNILLTNIAKYITINVNLKTYEDVLVTLENGEVQKLYKLARITMRNPNLIAINFSDNPVAIKKARLALQSLGDHSNIQQDGIMLYIPLPKITRERREELANKVSSSLFKEYKLLLNQIYSKCCKDVEKSGKNKESVIKLSNGLLKEMRSYVNLGEKKIKERKTALLSEVL